MVTIDVTSKDIRQGARMQCWRCPVALAASRAFGMEVRAGNGYLYTDLLQTPLPRDVNRRISAYDQGQPLRPFSFEVSDFREWDR